MPFENLSPARGGVHSAESLCSGFFIKSVCTRKVGREKRPPIIKVHSARTRKKASKLESGLALRGIYRVTLYFPCRGSWTVMD